MIILQFTFVKDGISGILLKSIERVSIRLCILEVWIPRLEIGNGRSVNDYEKLVV